MTHRHSVVFLMPDNADRRDLWTPQAQVLADSLNLDVHLVAEPFSANSIKSADAVMTSWGAPRLDEQFLDVADCLKIVGHAAGSVKPIISPALFERGIPVVSANDEMARGVAQWSLMMTMMASCKMLNWSNVGAHKAFCWDHHQDLGGLHGLTVGIWGYGAITRELIRLLRAVGVEQILVASNYLTDDIAAQEQLHRVGLTELFEQSDVVHLLTSLTDDRVGRVDADLLRRLVDGAALINAGRAHLVDETAMMKELTSGRLNAYLDVYHQEPLPDNHPLRGLSNVVLSPHNAGRITQALFVPMVLKEFDRCFRGQPLMHEVSPKYAAAMTTEYTCMA